MMNVMFVKFAIIVQCFILFSHQRQTWQKPNFSQRCHDELDWFYLQVFFFSQKAYMLDVTALVLFRPGLNIFTEWLINDLIIPW